MEGVNPAESDCTEEVAYQHHQTASVAFFSIVVFMLIASPGHHHQPGVICFLSASAPSQMIC
jgi:hypothetical protein